MEPAVPFSPLVECLYNKCEKLYQLAETIVKQHLEAGMLLDTDPGFLYPPNLVLPGGEHSELERPLASWDFFSSGLDVDPVWKFS